MTSRVIGSTDVYSRKKIDKEIDRLSRLHDLSTKRIRDLQRDITDLKRMLGAVLIEQD